MNKRVVFYSWQSDLPNATNRGFIDTALHRAVEAIRNDDSVEVEPVVDRDTANVPGSPDIAATIFQKIRAATVFVADVSIINQGQGGRPTPNPNVLVELGYALRSLGESGVVLVMNTAFGGPDFLPFDLRMRRVVTYDVRADAGEKADTRRKLASQLETAVGSILTALPIEIPAPAPTLADQVIAAVDAAQPNQAALVRQYMQRLEAQLVELAPDYSQEGAMDDLLVNSIDGSIGIVAEFSRVAAHIAIMNAKDAAQALYKGFRYVIGRYELPPGFNGGYRETDFDFFKFIGHELFTSYFALLIREQRWELMSELLSEGIYASSNRGSGVVGFERISQYVALLDQVRNQRLGLRRISVHADLINQRHTDGGLADAVSMPEFIDADLFLFLRSALSQTPIDYWRVWRPWTAVYSRWRVPEYLVEAINQRYATRLLAPLGVATLDELRGRFPDTAKALKEMFSQSLFFEGPFANFDPTSIGTS